MKKLLLAGFLGWIFTGAAAAQVTKSVPPGAPVNIVVTPGQAPSPEVSISRLRQSATVSPNRTRCSRTGGGNIDVQQPSSDTLVVTMTGVAVAYGTPIGAGSAGMDFNLTQCFEVSFDKPTVKAAKLTIEGRIIGLLRSSCKGGSASASGSAAISVENGVGMSLEMPSRAVSNGENLSINDREPPVNMQIPAGKYTLTQTFQILATMPRTGFSNKAPSVEFAPDPALDPIWISVKEPFHGASKKDFGFQITVKVVPDESKPEEKLGAPKKLSLIPGPGPRAILPVGDIQSPRIATPQNSQKR